MTEDEILDRAAMTTYRIAHDERMHEMFLEVRKMLEEMNVTRDELESYVMAWFTMLSMRYEQDKTIEDIEKEATAKTASFMFLIDHV